ncbi:MAG: peroxiredoxin-like family protein [Pseudomonadales bacterium]|jgi:peroxiredoxin
MTEISFLDKLAQLRATSCENLPTPELAVLTRTTARLRRSQISEKCLQSGETVPDFNFIDLQNSHRSFYDLLAMGPVVINFFRGFWCSFCKTELQAYTNIQKELEALGCYYLAISPQKPGAEKDVPDNYQVVFDRDNQIARQFGIVYPLESDEIKLFTSWGLRIDEVNESGKWELPLPATYLIRSDRTIGYEFVDVDFRARCCPDELMENVRQLV